MKITDEELLELIKKGKTATEIAENKKVSKQAVSKRIRKFREKGFVGVDEKATLKTRWLKCGNYKHYELTKRGQNYLRQLKNPFSSTRGALDTSMQVDNVFPQVEMHKYRVKVRIIEPGIPPPGSRENSKLRNWTLVYGDYLGCRYEITPKNIFITVRARGRTRKDVKKKLEKQVNKVVQLFLRFGWTLNKGTEVMNNGKIGVIHLLDKAPAQFGKLADIDRTPVNPTIHPHDETDADKIVKMARMADKYGNDITTLHNKCPLLNNNKNKDGGDTK